MDWPPAEGISASLVHVTLRNCASPNHSARLPDLLCQVARPTTQARVEISAATNQGEFTDLCGLDRTYVGGIERGERNVALVNLEKLARLLRFRSPNYFDRFELRPVNRVVSNGCQICLTKFLFWSP